MFLLKKVAAFCHCLKSLSEAKLKRLRLIALTKEVSEKPSIDFVLWFTLIKSVLIKHSKHKKGKYEKCGSSNKRAPESAIDLNPILQEIKRLRDGNFGERCHTAVFCLFVCTFSIEKELYHVRC